MPEFRLSWTFEPVALSPAEGGWRAVIVVPEGARVEPVIAWGVFHVKAYRDDTGELFTDAGNRIEAVVPTTDAAGRGFPGCAQDQGAAFYIGPTEQVPANPAHPWLEEKELRYPRSAEQSSVTQQ